MFDEDEPGKPKNWGWTIGIIIIISLLNICVFIVMRVLLDSENEFDEPIIQGDLRDDVTKFLGIFSLTFCFGCWCCFCCGGHCFRWSVCCNPKNWNIARIWANLLGQKFVNAKASVSTIRRKKGRNFDTDLEKNELDVSKLDELDRKRKSSMSSENTMFYERTVSILPPIRSDSTFVDSSPENQRLNRPSSFFPLSRQESRNDKWDDEECGRSFLMNQINDLDKKMVTSEEGITPERRKSLQVLQNQGTIAVKSSSARRGSTLAIRGVDFIQVPVQMLTPSTVGIVDRGHINPGFNETPTSPQEFTEVNIK